jgi:phosphoribosyl 1,2-cyclic phosphodiesterase
MPVQFAVLASGSKGNATLVRGRGAGVLIDVGMGPRTLVERLESVGASWSAVGAVALTHTHGDHVDTGTFAELARRRVMVYCHEGHRAGLAGDPGFQSLEAAGLVSCYDERPFLSGTGIRLEPIRLRHDGGPTFGFRIEVSAERRGRVVSLGYLADTGSWSEQMVETLVDVDALGVEFNHDVTMQRASGRPRLLIARNLGDQGHLSNGQGAELVAAVLARSRRGALRYLVLLHLSRQCNRPGLALDAARTVVRDAGCRVVVHAARQDPAHPNLWITPGRRVARGVVPASGRVAARPPARGGWSAGSAMTPALIGLVAADGDPQDGPGEAS